MHDKLFALFQEYSKPQYVDPSHGNRHLFDDNTKREVAKLLIHAKRGCLSDPQNVPLYYEKGRDKDGLTLWRCVRGTSDVEGAVHQKISYKFRAWNAGPEYADSALAILRDRHNVRASQRNRPNFPTLGHYEHYLVDHIQVITKQLYGRPVHDWWVEPTNFVMTKESFGVLPVVPLDQQEVDLRFDDPRMKDYNKSTKFLATRMKTVVPHVPVQTRDEMALFKSSVVLYFADNKFDMA